MTPERVVDGTDVVLPAVEDLRLGVMGLDRGHTTYVMLAMPTSCCLSRNCSPCVWCLTSLRNMLEWTCVEGEDAMSFLPLLALVLTVLKVLGFFTYSWWWVFAPAILQVFLVVGIVVGIVFLEGK